MKNSAIVSGIVGGAFFAVPYLALAVPLWPSLAIGAAAFGAGELLLHDRSNKLKETNRSLYDTIQDAKRQNKQILEMVSRVENSELKTNIKEINQSAGKIIAAVEKAPEKAKKMNNFFEYYLPVTLNILRKYDEIENQDLNTKDGQKFMKETEEMIAKINESFKNQLSNVYQADMIDTDAEMKVFETMLKTDGYYDTESDFKKGGKNSEG